MADANERVQELSNRVEQGFRDLRDQIDPFTKMSKRIDGLEAKIDDLDAKIDRLSEQLEPLAEAVQRLDELRDKIS